MLVNFGSELCRFFCGVEVELGIDEVDDELGALVASQGRHVDAEVVGLGGSPGVAGTEIVVIRTLCIGLLDDFRSSLAVDVLLAHDLVDAVFEVGGDEDADAMGMVAEDVVGSTTDNDARMFGGDARDDAALEGVDVVVGKLAAVVEVAASDEWLYCSKDLVQKTFVIVDGGLGMVEDTRSEACVFSGLR